MSATSPASPTETASRPGPAPHPSTPLPVNRTATASPELATGGSTTCSTSPQSPSSGSIPRDAPTTDANEPQARSPWKRCAASSDGSPTSSTASSSPMPNEQPSLHQLMQSARAREGTAGRLKNPARSTCPRTSTLRISHFPDPHNRRYNPPRRSGRPRRGRPLSRPVDNRGEPEGRAALSAGDQVPEAV